MHSNSVASRDAPSSASAYTGSTRVVPFFAVLMSVANIGGDVAKFAGAAMTDALGVTNNNFAHLWVVVALRIAACSIPAILAGILGKVYTAHRSLACALSLCVSAVSLLFLIFMLCNFQ
eukprot:SAG31_NODE_9989_length_1200_cov_1.534968_2_plen_119_part_00